MKILVTGGAGYIGSHIVKLLGEKTDAQITILDNLVTGFRDSVLYGSFIQEDLNNTAAIDKIFSENRFDAVIHLAASLVVPESVTDPHKYYLNNTMNTAKLLSTCVKYGVKKFIFSSTAAVYGEPDASEMPVTETSPTQPINPYGWSKLMSEQIIRDTAKAFPDFKYVILRYFNVAGSDHDGLIGQSTRNATHLIKVAVQAALGKRDKISVFGTDYPTPDGTCVRDYIHVEDLAQAHLDALGYLDNNPSDCFNCGYGNGYSVNEILRTVASVSKVDFAVEMADRRAGDPAILVSDCSRIKEKMKWTPKYNDIEFICRTALEWEKKL